MVSQVHAFSILQLPRELRDLIYRHWVTDVYYPGGLVYEFSRNELVQASGKGIGLSLLLACHQIASEVSGLVFQVNGIIFKTTALKTHLSQVYARPRWLLHGLTQGHLQRAAEINATIRRITDYQSVLLNELAPVFLDPELVITAGTCFPQFRPLLKFWQAGQRVNIAHYRGTLLGLKTPWGETRSEWVEFTNFVLGVMSQIPGFMKEAGRLIESWSEDEEAWKCDSSKVINARPLAWAIYGHEETERLRSMVFATPLRLDNRIFRSYSMRFRYSAASWAIRFLQSASHLTKSSIRKIVLLEDEVSVSNAPSHAQGLIQFCRQYPDMRLERIVKLWTAGLSPDKRPEKPLRTSIITKSFGRWMFEALLLRKLGMPKDSFKLVLDGSPILAKSSELFEAVKSDAVGQAAMDICYDRGILKRPSWIERRQRMGYQWKSLPEAITNLQKGEYASFIECNFDLGIQLDPETLVTERRGWTAEDWEAEWASRQNDSLETEPSLPSWHTLHPVAIADW